MTKPTPKPTPKLSPAPRPGIMAISSYVPGISQLPGGVVPIKLSSNETPLGASPAATKAYAAAAAKLERYPDGQATILRQAIGDRYDLNIGQIVCGAGSDELLSLLAYGFLGQGDEAIYSRHGFLMYKIAIQAAGATPVVAPETDLTSDVDAILVSVTPRTKCVFLANPNNPTGTYLAANEVQRLRDGLPAHVLLILDAAYAEYVVSADYEAGIAMVAAGDNTVMTRTFSKLHGLAALRIGWAYCPVAVADILNRIRGPFNLNAPAIQAGAAAMADDAFMATSVAFNETWRGWVRDELIKLGLGVTPSVGNFLLIKFPDEPRHNAPAADKFLQSKAIILRRVDSYGLAGYLRMTIGTERENRAVIDALNEFLGGKDV